jgi:hypothetical protein
VQNVQKVPLNIESDSNGGVTRQPGRIDLTWPAYGQKTHPPFDFNILAPAAGATMLLGL